MLYMKAIGLFIAFAVIAAGVAATAIKTDIMWFLPMANSIIWLHYGEILRKPITPVANSFVYFTAIILTLLILNLYVLRNLQFTNLESEVE
jgi:hypothetical protein